MISTIEQETYSDIWQVPSYNDFSPGEVYAPVFLDIAKPAPSSLILDAGCGAGRGALALRAAGMRVALMDITSAGLSEEIRSEFPFFENSLWAARLHTLAPRAQKFYGGSAVSMKFDYVYSCDVFEHLPKEFTMLALSNLLSIASRGVFLSIAMTPDNFGVWVGKPLHQTVESFVWWRDHIKELGVLIEARDFGDCGIFFVSSN